MADLKPKDLFTQLLGHLIEQIDSIDQTTPFEPIEPTWWLHMMELQRKAREMMDTLK